MILALCAGVSGVQAQGERDVSRFQQPTEEREIDAPDEGGVPDAQEGDDSLAGAGGLGSLEQRLYLRERPDTLGRAARDFQHEQLEKLLEQRERLVQVRRRQAIELLEEFIREEPEDAAEMPDALLRLAELRWEQAREEYLDAFAAWQEVPAENRGPEPRPDYATALELYDRILDQHPDFERLDLVLYMKAFALMERGDGQGALAMYRRILEDFPESRFVPDSHFALAEARFNTGDFEGALSRYENVLEHRQSALADIALFKSAWCLWKLGRNKEAATRFRRVLDLESRRGELTSAQRRRLRDLQDEALSYLIQVFTEDESNTAADVFDFLESIGGEKYAGRVLGRLSKTYVRQGRFGRGIEAYELLLEMNPTVPEAPRYQREIAKAYGAMGDADKVYEALHTLAETYEPDSTWARQQGDPEILREQLRKNEKLIRTQALKYHERGQREDDEEQLRHAARLYRVYLDHFPGSPNAYQIQFYMAEILFHRLERWAEAGEAYLTAARLDPEGEYTRDALYNAIGAFERVREEQLERCAEGAGTASGAEAEEPEAGEVGAEDAEGEEAEAPRGEPSGEGETIECGETDNDRKFAAAIELYVELYPDDPDLPEILFRQGRLYYDRGIYDPAVKLFGQLLERFPNSDFAEPAGELILDSFNQAEDYENIEKWARRLKEAPAFQSEEKQKRLNGLIVQSVFKLGEQLAERGEHLEAANAYYRAAEEFPADERAPKAYYNAGLERQRAGDLPGAVEAYDRLIEKRPDSEQAPLAAWSAAQMYESIAQFRDAASYYEIYAEKFPEADKSLDALYNAVLLRVTAGDHDEAVEAGKKFVDRYPRHETVDDVYFFIGRAHEGAERWDAAARTYRQFIRRSRNPDRKVEAQTRLAQVLLEAGEQGAAERVLDQARRTAKRNRRRLEEGLYYAAQARYMQGDMVLAEYESVKIAGPVDGLKQRLQRKSELLKEAATIYADVVDYNVAEWVTAALYQIGHSYELFAEAMRDAPIPDGLTQQEEQVYRDELMMFIVPMEERALQAYEGGYDKALELRIFNSWTAKLREALTRLNDIQYPPLRETGGDIVESAPLPMPRPLEALTPRRGGEQSEQGAKPGGERAREGES